MTKSIVCISTPGIFMRQSMVLCLIFLSTLMLNAQPALNLVPWPVEVKQHSGFFLLKNKITVSNSLPAHSWKKLLPYFKSEMKKQFGIEVSEAAAGKKGDIDFFMKRMPTSGKPAYTISVTKSGIAINSNFDEPAFHAMQTLFQLIPLDTKTNREIPFVEIFDHARFGYRGMHLDVARHFFPVAFIKKYIDYLAYHKLNTFHWHLTDDQGWRIPINKYPLLTQVGGNRNGTIIGRYPGQGSDNIPYGGFYTIQEIKDVVAYARERFIDVIPEIEMPGHGSAAIAAYPWLSCFPGKPTDIPANMISKKSIAQQQKGRIKLVQETWGVFDDIFCAGKDSTFTFLQNVIDEVVPLFPSKYFHIGGDEAPKTHWKQCPRCQQRIKELQLKDEHELQSYFVQRIEKYLNTKGKTLIGWDEILEGGLAPNAVVMSWRGEKGGIEAAKQKHQVIMTPGNPVYFDHTQSENEDSVTIGGFNPIEKVYAYEPVSKELSDEEGKYILGAQANLWTEYIRNTKKVEYMIFPRMAALSEILWTRKENRNWEHFEKRLPAQMKRYEKWEANYSKAYYDLKAAILPSENQDGIILKLSSKNESDVIKCNTILPVGKIFNYTAPIKINQSYIISSWIEKEKINSPRLALYIRYNKATGKKITLKEEASKKYPGDGAFTLVNGVQNEKGLGRSREFLGFEGTDCEAVIDLGVKTEFSEVVVNSFTQTASWIYPPRSVSFSVSDDGINFTQPQHTVFSDIEPHMGRKTRVRNQQEEKFSARYIKVSIQNYGLIPDGKPGAGNKAWLFIDEIEVN